MPKYSISANTQFKSSLQNNVSNYQGLLNYLLKLIIWRNITSQGE